MHGHQYYPKALQFVYKTTDRSISNVMVKKKKYKQLSIIFYQLHQVSHCKLPNNTCSLLSFISLLTKEKQ